MESNINYFSGNSFNVDQYSYADECNAVVEQQQYMVNADFRYMEIGALPTGC